MPCGAKTEPESRNKTYNMSLLPRTAEEFSSAEYWERFFKKRRDKAFEWYGDYNKLCGVLHKYIKVTDKVKGNMSASILIFHFLKLARPSNMHTN